MPQKQPARFAIVRGAKSWRVIEREGETCKNGVTFVAYRYATDPLHRLGDATAALERLQAIAKHPPAAVNPLTD